ncbi:MAG: hypothetical protein Q4G59_13185, partial [Planctomycetia bacterium]|nr:hypothetical protein [Planctomycetia bacterium]
RQLLSVSPAEIQSIRDTYGDFVIASDVNTDINLFVDGECTGSHTVTTFSHWSNNQSGNNIYDETIPLFTRDYNFANKTEGDYRLVFDPESQGIDRGSNSEAQAAGLDSKSTDVLDQSRFQNGTIDLGAYEHQPTNFDAAFPTRLSVQQGCSLNICCEGTDSKGNAISRYYIDLNGDGTYDKTGANIWISWDELSEGDGVKGYFWLAIENSLGEISEVRQVAVHVNETSPSISVKQSSLNRNQIVKLNVSVFCYGRSIQQWTINWGDESIPAQYDIVTRSLNATHYYSPKTETTTYSITLCLIDSNGNGNETSYHIGWYTVIGSNSSSVLTQEAVLEPPAIPTCDVPEQTAPLLTGSSVSQANAAYLATSDLGYRKVLGIILSEISMPIVPTLSAASNDNNHVLSDEELVLFTPVHFLSSKSAKRASVSEFNLFSDDDNLITKDDLIDYAQTSLTKANNELDVVFSFFDEEVLDTIGRNIENG